MPKQRRENPRPTPFGNWLRARRVACGWTQGETAERFGGNMTQSDISQYERGATALPSVARLQRFAEIFEEDIGVLLDEVDRPQYEEGLLEYAAFVESLEGARRELVTDVLPFLSQRSVETLIDMGRYLMEQEHRGRVAPDPDDWKEQDSA